MSLAFLILAASGVSVIRKDVELYKGYVFIRGQDLSKPEASPSTNVYEKWRIEFNRTVKSYMLADYEGNSFEGIVAALGDNDIVFINRHGRLDSVWNIGDRANTGEVYDMMFLDYDNDGVKEIVMALGGYNVVREYQPHEFEFTEDKGGGQISIKDRVLYRVKRSLGGYRIYTKDGVEKFSNEMLDGVRSLNYIETDSTPYIIAGVGESTTYTFNEKVKVDPEGRVWTDMKEVFIVENWDGINQGSTKQICEDRCDRYDEEYCGFDDSDPYDPKCCCLKELRPTIETCRYNICKYPGDFCGYDGTVNPPRCCCIMAGDTIGQWILTEEFVRNGSIQYFDENGVLTGIFDFSRRIKDFDALEENLNVRDIWVGDVENDGMPDIIVGLDNGYVIRLNTTSSREVEKNTVLWKTQLEDSVRGIEAGELGERGEYSMIVGTGRGMLYALGADGKVKWRSFVEGGVSGILLTDLEKDGILEIVAVSPSKRLYVFDANTGALNWRYVTYKPLYGVYATDLDGNGLTDLVISTDSGLLCLELSEYYVKKRRADTLIWEAEMLFDLREYTQARIKAERALNLYNEIKAMDDIPRAENLVIRLDIELRESKKREADFEYEKAVNFYALNRFDESVFHLNVARKIYVDLENSAGVGKVDSMLGQIEREKIVGEKLRADSLYSRALAYKNFGNTTLALEMAWEARGIYEGIQYYNGSINCDLLVKQIADSKLNTAQNQYGLRNYKSAMDNAEYAKSLYINVSRFDKATEADLLLLRINASMHEKPDGGGLVAVDYSKYILVGLGFIIVVVLFRIFDERRRLGRLKPKSKSSAKMEEAEWDLSDLPEELEELDK